MGEGTSSTAADRQAIAVLAAALGVTCPSPVDNPSKGFCSATRHMPQAEKLLGLLRDQGFDVARPGRVSAAGRSGASGDEDVTRDQRGPN